MDEYAPGETTPEPQGQGTGSDVAALNHQSPAIKIPTTLDTETDVSDSGAAHDASTVVLPSGAVLSVASDSGFSAGVESDATAVVLPSGEVLNGSPIGDVPVHKETVDKESLDIEDGASIMASPSDAPSSEVEPSAIDDATTVVLPSGAVLTGVSTSGFETGLTPDSVDPQSSSGSASVDEVEPPVAADVVSVGEVEPPVAADVVSVGEVEPPVASGDDEPAGAPGWLDSRHRGEPAMTSALFDASAHEAPAVEPYVLAAAGVNQIEPAASAADTDAVEPAAGAAVVEELAPAPATAAPAGTRQETEPVAPAPSERPPDHSSTQSEGDDHSPAPSAEQIASLPAVSRRPNDVAMTPSTAMTAAAANQPIQVVIDPRLMAPTTLPRSMQWSPAQVLQVLVAAGLIAVLGLIAGWFYGGTKDAEYTARSEFIYFLEDALPDGFLREDRRILTQLVTIESETSLRPIAAEFGTTVDDLRKQLTVEVIDLSEVIRLDIVDPDTTRALAINEAVLDRYQELAAETDRRPGDEDLIAQRDTILDELQIADEQVATAADAELSDVSLQLQEESLSRELNAASERVNRLSSIADGLLTETTVVDDRGSIESQISRSQQRLDQLEAELLQIRSERATLQQTIARQLASETPFAAASNQQRDVTLGVREDSVQLEIDTVSQGIRSLESALASSLLDTTVTVDGSSVEGELVQSRQLVSDLEAQLLVVRTRRIELAQSAASKPSLLRTIERLEQDLAALDARIADANLDARNPSPIEVLTEPVVLTKQANNPNLTWAALGLLASLPLAALVGAVVRQRQRKRA